MASSAPCSPRTAESRTEVMVPAAAMRVLEGTQSVSTLAPPMPSRSMTVTCGTELRGDQRGLVAGRSAADDHDAGHGSFSDAGATVRRPFSPVPSRTAVTGVLRPGASGR